MVALIATVGATFAWRAADLVTVVIPDVLLGRQFWNRRRREHTSLCRGSFGRASCACGGYSQAAAQLVGAARARRWPRKLSGLLKPAAPFALLVSLEVAENVPT